MQIAVASTSPISGHYTLLSGDLNCLTMLRHGAQQAVSTSVVDYAALPQPRQRVGVVRVPQVDDGVHPLRDLDLLGEFLLRQAGQPSKQATASTRHNERTAWGGVAKHGIDSGRCDRHGCLCIPRGTRSCYIHVHRRAILRFLVFSCFACLSERHGRREGVLGDNRFSTEPSYYGDRSRSVNDSSCLPAPPPYTHPHTLG